MKSSSIVTVLGAGNMGTALALVLADNGNIVNIWNWEGDHLPLKQIEKSAENKKYLKGIKLSKNIFPKYKMAEALQDSEIIFFAIPSGVLEHTISFAARSVENKAILVDVSKGLEPHTLRLMTDVIAKHVRTNLKKNIVSLSGPAIASQIAKRQLTAMNVASKNNSAIKKVRQVLENNYIKLIPTNDVIGVELGGSFKNVYAILMGVCDGLGYGLNSKAAILTQAVSEMADIIKVMGGKRKTAYDLVGLGDLVGTSLARESRNRSFGECIGKGMKNKAALKKVKQTVEGIDATRSLITLAEKYGLELPLARLTANIISGKVNPRTGIEKCLERNLDKY